MKLKRTVVAPALVAGAALVSGGWLLQRGAAGERSVYSQAQLFDQVMDRVNRYYVDPHPPADLYRFAVQGMLDELGDPHTTFLTPEEYQELRVTTTGEFAGLGIHVSRRDDWVTAVAIVPGTPAERAGVRVGDRMIEINGESTRGWDEDYAVKKLRGPQGTTATIKVMRVGVEEPVTFRIVRQPIHVRSVPYAYMMDDQVGYLQLTVFSETSTQEIQAAIQRLRQQGMRKLVLDLRENPGGLLDQGVGVSDLFLKPGLSIVETRGRDPRENETFRAVTPESYEGLPMVVLVNGYSASAAEIVAGALQDHDRALVIGSTSYGKGSVQSLFPLSGGNVLKMTTAKWYTPSGRSIQKDRRPGEEEDTLADAGEAGPDGTPVLPDSAAPAAPDTSRRRAYRTDAGRVVFGGGGIVPDLAVKGDTATLAEQDFFRAAGKEAVHFQGALFRYAVEYARDHPGLRRDFTVTQAMRDELYRRIREAGVPVTREQYDGARRFIDLRLVDEIATARFGLAAAAERDDQNDATLREARRLLRAAPDQAALFRLARAQAAQARRAAPARR